MPSSPNRRRVELPADLYSLLEARARLEHTTVAALTAMLLRHQLDADGCTPDAASLVQRALVELRELTLGQRADVRDIREYVRLILLRDLAVLPEMRQLHEARLQEVREQLIAELRAERRQARVSREGGTL